MKTTIFLDIDGVLVTLGAWYPPLRPFRDIYGFLFQPTCVENLNRIIKETGAKIVISSTWRSSGLKVLKQMFADRGVKGEIIGTTPISTIDDLYFRREDEIKAWLEKNGLPDKFIATDDMTLNELGKNWIKTSALKGITPEVKDKAIDFLNE